MRNIVPGYRDLQGLVTMDGVSSGIYEYQQPIYNLEEQTEEERIFSINESVRDLILNLEAKTEQGGKSEA